LAGPLEIHAHKRIPRCTRNSRDFVSVTRKLALGNPPWYADCIALTAATHISLLREFYRRRKTRESPAGKAVRRFIVEGDEASLILLLRLATSGLRFHPEYPNLKACDSDPRTSAKREVDAMACEAIVERLAPILKGHDRLRARLEASISGKLNRVPENARHAVREKLQILYKHRSRLLRLDAENCETQRAFSHNPTSRMDQNVLIEQIRQHPGLDTSDKQIVNMVLDGHEQREIARSLGISQQAVAKRLRRIASKIIA
jgi:DNA-binding CsgD family transcriptional regulator